MVRLSDVAQVELGERGARPGEAASTASRRCTFASGRCPARTSSRSPTLLRAGSRRSGRRCPRTGDDARLRRHVLHGRRDSRRSPRRSPRRSRSSARGVPVHGLGPHRARAADRDAVSLIGACVVDVRLWLRLNLLTMLAIVLSVGLVVDDAIVVVENVERHVRVGKTRSRRPCRRARAARAHHRDDDHARGGLRAHRLSGRPDRRAVPRVRLHARRGRDRFGFRGRDALAGHERRASSRPAKERPVHAFVNRGFDQLRDRTGALLDQACRCGARVRAGRRAHRGGRRAALHVSRQKELAPEEDESHRLLRSSMLARRDASLDYTLQGLRRVAKSFPKSEDKFCRSTSPSRGAASAASMKDWQRAQTPRPSKIYGEFYGAAPQVPGCACSRALDPPLPASGQYDVELIVTSTRGRRADGSSYAAVRRRGVRQRQVPVRRHRSEDRPAADAAS